MLQSSLLSAGQRRTRFCGTVWLLVAGLTSSCAAFASCHGYPGHWLVELPASLTTTSSQGQDALCRADDFYRILTEPQHNMLKQHTALLATEGVELSFSEEAVREVARVAAQVLTLQDAREMFDAHPLKSTKARRPTLANSSRPPTRLWQLLPSWHGTPAREAACVAV